MEFAMITCTSTKSVEIGVVRGHPRSSAIKPFDRAHITSY